MYMCLTISKNNYKNTLLPKKQKKNSVIWLVFATIGQRAETLNLTLYTVVTRTHFHDIGYFQRRDPWTLLVNGHSFWLSHPSWDSFSQKTIYLQSDISWSRPWLKLKMGITCLHYMMATCLWITGPTSVQSLLPVHVFTHYQLQNVGNMNFIFLFYTL